MDNLDDDLSLKQKEFVASLEKSSNKDSFEQKDEFKEETLEVFHLNSLITKIFIFIPKIQTINCLPGLWFSYLYLHYFLWWRNL